MHVSRKPGFPQTSRLWMVLIFIANIKGTMIRLYIKKKKKEKKIFFAQERRGCPLKVVDKNTLEFRYYSTCLQKTIQWSI